MLAHLGSALKISFDPSLLGVKAEGIFKSHSLQPCMVTCIKSFLLQPVLSVTCTEYVPVLCTLSVRFVLPSCQRYCWALGHSAFNCISAGAQVLVSSPKLNFFISIRERNGIRQSVQAGIVGQAYISLVVSRCISIIRHCIGL